MFSISDILDASIEQQGLPQSGGQDPSAGASVPQTVSTENLKEKLVFSPSIFLWFLYKNLIFFSISREGSLFHVSNFIVVEIHCFY